MSVQPIESRVVLIVVVSNTTTPASSIACAMDGRSHEEDARMGGGEEGRMGEVGDRVPRLYANQRDSAYARIADPV